MAHMRFPLPEGHEFGPGISLRRHRGDEWRDLMAVGHIQTTLKNRWKAHVWANGHYDGATQEAVIQIQKQFGLDPTGAVDAETWDLIFKATP